MGDTLWVRPAGILKTIRRPFVGRFTISASVTVLCSSLANINFELVRYRRPRLSLWLALYRVYDIAVILCCRPTPNVMSFPVSDVRAITDIGSFKCRLKQRSYFAPPPAGCEVLR